MPPPQHSDNRSHRSSDSLSETARHARAGAARYAWIALALAAVLSALPFLRGGWFDVRWCAALASAWLDVLTVALGARLALTPSASISTPVSTASPTLADGVGDAPAWQRWRRAGSRALGRAALEAGARGRAIRWQPWAMLVCAALALYAASIAWNPPVRFVLALAMQPRAAAIVAAGGALALAFGTLFAELSCAQHAARGRAWASLADALRVALAAALMAAASFAWQAHSDASSRWPVQIVAAFCAALAIECALRAVLSWFAPPHARRGDAAVPDSFVASLLRWRPSPFARFGAELRRRYGIDLRQNWVLLSIVRLLPAAVASMVVCAWLLTGVAILGPDQRAVYERFGAPVAVWQPGLHVALPWPFGRARLIDNGAVHQVIVSGSTDDSSVAAPLVPADARTPAVFDRLWDVAHRGETSQVIAGASTDASGNAGGDRQNFQTVNADVRLDYRIGLSDAAARAALYRIVDVPATIRSVANREVVRYLASHTLESLLETRQTAMADDVKRAIQTQLDRAESGIDVVAVVIESVHPPAGASAAYHGVQAARILAQGSVAQASGAAAALLGHAKQDAYAAIAQANAQAADITSAARAQQAGFSADVDAAQAGGRAFVLEYYLHNLQKGLQNAHVTIIDDRLVSGNRATVDLRPYGAGDLAGLHRAE